MHMYVIMGQHVPLKSAPSCEENLDHHRKQYSLGLHDSATEWHLDQFSHFCTAHLCV